MRPLGAVVDEDVAGEVEAQHEQQHAVRAGATLEKGLETVDEVVWPRNVSAAAILGRFRIRSFHHSDVLVYGEVRLRGPVGLGRRRRSRRLLPSYTECVNSSVTRFASKFLCKFLLQFSSCLAAQQL